MFEFNQNDEPSEEVIKFLPYPYNELALLEPGKNAKSGVKYSTSAFVDADDYFEFLNAFFDKENKEIENRHDYDPKFHAMTSALGTICNGNFCWSMCVIVDKNNSRNDTVWDRLYFLLSDGYDRGHILSNLPVVCKKFLKQIPAMNTKVSLQEEVTIEF